MVDKIFHLGDIHVRNLKRHDEYFEVFNKVLDYIEKNKGYNSIIYLAGDIAHSKTEISPELVFVIANLLSKLSELCPVFIIKGNHDYIVGNSSRLDVITPIFKALNNPNIFFLNENGIHTYDNIIFSYMDLSLDQKNYVLAKDIVTPDKYLKVALYHGPVNNSKNDLGFVFEDRLDISLFDGFDYALLGDIHRFQYLNEQKTIAYCGSLIQQDYGESLDKGFIEWDLNLKTSKFIKIPNKYGYLTLNIVDGLLEKPLIVPENPRIRVLVKNTPLSNVEELLKDFKSNYNVQDILISKVKSFEKKENLDSVDVNNLRNVDFQNKLMFDYVNLGNIDIKPFKIEDLFLKNKIINDRILKSEENLRNIIWRPLYFEFSNMFSYGENNYIDFKKLKGINGIFAPNAYGKSGLVDALLYCIFDRCTRTSNAKDVLNINKSYFNCKFCFEINGTVYYIIREGYLNKDSVKVDVQFYYEDSKEGDVYLNGTQRSDTNKNIRKYFGKYEDFIITVLSTQYNNSNFLDKTQSERKDTLSSFIDIGIYETLSSEANSLLKEVNLFLGKYNEQKLNEDKVILLNSNSDIKEKTKDLKIEVENLEKKIAEHTEIIDSLNRDYIPVENFSEVENLQKELELIDTNVDEEEKLNKSSIIELDSVNFKLEEVDKELKNIVNCDEDFLNSQEINYNLFISFSKSLEFTNIQINNLQSKVDKLSNYEYNPDCEFCLKNPFVEDALKAVNLLKEEKDKLTAIQKDITSLDFIGVEEFKNLKSNKEFYKKLENKKTILISTKNELESKIKNYQLTIKNYLTNKENIIEKIKNQEKQKNIVEKNKVILERLTLEKTKLEILQNNLKKIVSEMYEYRNIYLNNIKGIKGLEESIEEIKKLKFEKEIVEIYLKIVKRDGIPYFIINQYLPKIESEINSILGFIVDFQVSLETDGKNINIFIVYNENKNWPLDLASGMEKFITSIAIRIAMIRFSNLPRPNFIIIDEGFGVLDSDIMGSLSSLFDFIKSEFDFSIIISHISSMKDLMDSNVIITKENNYSKVNN